jgi:hypothetical protein
MHDERKEQGHHYGGKFHGMCRCDCHGGRFVGKKERTEMLEEYLESLKNEMKGVEEELNGLKK